MAKAKAKLKSGSERRDDALSRDRIVSAAIELLDAKGEDGFTFRDLATHLATGAGAIYWHVANKSELLVAASDAVVAHALSEVGTHATPKKTIRKIAVTVFEAIDAHPWVGTQLARNPWPTAMLQIAERIGQQIQALKVPSSVQFTAATALSNWIIGESRQNAANGRAYDPPPDRADFLAQMSVQWEKLDAREYPFIRSVATRLREHDDRAEFLAGVDLILAGIATAKKK